MAIVVVATKYGGPDGLAVLEQPTRDPGSGEVRVAVRAIGVNPFDLKSYSGAFGTDLAKLPIHLGGEAAGIITASGSNAVGPAGPIQVGDEVIVFRTSGAYASELIAPASSIVPKPAALDWAPAGGLMTTGATAFHLLTVTDTKAGETVLIHGGSGGVGLMAVQLATARGARVIATASASRHELLRTLGAEPVAYGPGLTDRVRALAPDGVDVALDTAGTDEAVDTSIELVADRNRIATIVAFGRGFELGLKVLGGGPGADPGTEVRDAARLVLVRLVDEGALRVFVGDTFALTDAAAAHEKLATGRAGGKIILIP
jgi:NADPH:quinone reductase-like Zn-dependent oxidoreductase